jgi:hypothetical protein
MSEEKKKHTAWSILGGLMSAAFAVFLIVHQLKAKG